MKFVCIIILLAGSAIAASEDPGKSAIGFLEKVRSGDLSLEPGKDTAISAQVTARKREEIQRRLDRIARDLGDSQLEIGPVKLDGELAAVIVRKVGGFDPSRLQVFPIGLIRLGDAWRATPVPASFENTGASFSAGVRSRLSELETWMMREQVTDLENLREEAAERMRRSIRQSLPEAEVRAFSAEQAAARFLSACTRRQLTEILGMLGGLSPSLPSNWPERLRVAEAAVRASSECPRPWQLLTSPTVLRLPVFHDPEPDGGSAIHSVACLDPAGHSKRSGTGRIEVIHIPVSRGDDGLWQVDPPAEFFSGTESSTDSEAPEDASLLDLFPSKFASAHPPAPAPTAAVARDALVAALQERNRPAWASLLHLEGDPPLRRVACARAAKIWWDAGSPAGIRLAIPIDFQEVESSAVVALQFFDARNPDRFDLRALHLQKTEMGWLWNPSPSDEIESSTRPWMESNQAQWRQSWRKQLLSSTPMLSGPGNASTPAQEAIRLVESFIRGAAEAEIASCLGLTARLDLPDSADALLRNLGHEIATARASGSSFEILGTHSAGSITAVSTRRLSGGKILQTLYPVAMTPSGPRILLEIDLIASRSRDFLNRSALDRIGKSDASSAEKLAGLLKQLQPATTPDGQK